MTSTILASPNYWLGTILVAWIASRAFQWPYALGYVRDRTDFRRYNLGLAVFVLAAWMTYTLTWIVAWRMSRHYQLKEGAVAISAVILVAVVLPNLPVLSRNIRRLRDFTQVLAGFPRDVDELVLLLGRPRDVCEQYPAQLGFLEPIGRRLSASCMKSVREAIRIRKIFESKYSAEAETVWPSALAAAVKRRREASLERYLYRRRSAIGRLDNDYFQLLRRARRIGQLVEDQPLSQNQLKQISAFLADQAEDLIERYQKLSAQTAIAVFPAGEPRAKFLEYLGYSVPQSIPSLPLWPILVVLVVEVTTSAIGFVLTSGVASSWTAPLSSGAGAIFSQGFAMTAAVTLAIAPKLMWAWARPAMFAKPALVSYLIFGLATYVCGFVCFFVVQSEFAPQRSPNGGGFALPFLAMILLPPGLFAVSNVVLSWRIDRRIIASCYERGWPAVRDSLWLLAATILFIGFFRASMIGFFGVPWSSLPNIWLIVLVLGASAVVIGYAVPQWAVLYIYPPATLRAARMPSMAISKSSPMMTGATLAERENVL
jgi:hypothetical protein